MSAIKFQNNQDSLFFSALTKVRMAKLRGGERAKSEMTAAMVAATAEACASEQTHKAWQMQLYILKAEVPGV